jgi:hypothetical protein
MDSLQEQLRELREVAIFLTREKTPDTIVGVIVRVGSDFVALEQKTAQGDPTEWIIPFAAIAAIKPTR